MEKFQAAILLQSVGEALAYRNAHKNRLQAQRSPRSCKNSGSGPPRALTGEMACGRQPHHMVTTPSCTWSRLRPSPQTPGAGWPVPGDGEAPWGSATEASEHRADPAAPEGCVQLSSWSWITTSWLGMPLAWGWERLASPIESVLEKRPGALPLCPPTKQLPYQLERVERDVPRLLWGSEQPGEPVRPCGRLCREDASFPGSVVTGTQFVLRNILHCFFFKLLFYSFYYYCFPQTSKKTHTFVWWFNVFMGWCI